MSTDRFRSSPIDKVIDIQRRLNEYDALMFRWVQQSSTMSEHERAMFIKDSQHDYALLWMDCWLSYEMNTEPATPDNALDLLLQWPLVILVLDGYEPRLAQIVIDTISEQSEGTITMLWNVASDSAREGMTWN